MRCRSELTPSGQVFAVAGTNTVTFGVVAPAAAQEGLKGYAVARRDVGADEWRVMNGFKVFKSVVPHPTQDLRVSTTDHPVQSFMWDDFLAEPDHLYEYEFRPAKGEPGALRYDDPPIRIAVRTEPLYGSTHDVFFNRGVASSQYYVREFGDTPIEDLDQAKKARALSWLSRDLDDAMLKFVADCEPGDRLFGAFYEFRYEPMARALTEAVDRGVDVRLVLDGKRNEHTTKGEFFEAFPREANLAMLAKVAFPADRVVLREARRSAIAHNKFMVRAPKGRPAAEVWTGSTNLSLGGVAGQTNVGHWVRDRAVAAKFQQYWTLLSTDPGGHTGAPDVRQRNAELKQAVEELSPVTAADLDPSTAGVTPAFSPRPDTDLLDRYTKALDDAERQACITLAFGVGAGIKAALMDNTTTGPLEFLLLEKQDRPAQGKPFVRLSAANNVYSAWGSFLRDPVYQWVRETSALELGLNQHVAYIHSKFLLVDPLGEHPLVITGSANFSVASTKENDENMLIIRGDQRVADIYYTEFNRLFNHYYFRSVVEDTGRRRSGSATTAGANRFLDETDGWTGKYAAGHFRAKHLGVVASMAGSQVLPVNRTDGPTLLPSRATPARTAEFEVYADRRGRYRWRLRAANGQVVAQGQSYATRAAARHAVDAVRRAAASATT